MHPSEPVNLPNRFPVQAVDGIQKLPLTHIAPKPPVRTVKGAPKLPLTHIAPKPLEPKPPASAEHSRPYYEISPVYRRFLFLQGGSHQEYGTTQWRNAVQMVPAAKNSPTGSQGRGQQWPAPNGSAPRSRPVAKSTTKQPPRNIAPETSTTKPAALKDVQNLPRAQQSRRPIYPSPHFGTPVNGMVQAWQQGSQQYGVPQWKNAVQMVPGVQAWPPSGSQGGGQQQSLDAARALHFAPHFVPASWLTGPNVYGNMPYQHSPSLTGLHNFRIQGQPAVNTGGNHFNAQLTARLLPQQQHRPTMTKAYEMMLSQQALPCGTEEWDNTTERYQIPASMSNSMTGNQPVQGRPFPGQPFPAPGQAFSNQPAAIMPQPDQNVLIPVPSQLAGEVVDLT